MTGITRITATVALDDGTVFDMRWTINKRGEISQNSYLLAGSTDVRRNAVEAILESLSHDELLADPEED